MVIITALPTQCLEPATSLPGHLWDWLRLKTQSTEFSLGFILPAQLERDAGDLKVLVSVLLGLFGQKSG